MTKFVRSILTHYRVTPSQLSELAWCTVLGFEALCALSISETCQGEVFSAAYALRKINQDTGYFVPQIGCENIINMMDSDHSMRDSVVWVTNPWEAE